MKSRRKKSPRKTNFVFNPLFRNLGLLNTDPLVLRFRHFIGSFPQPRFDETLQMFWHHADKYLWQKGQLVCEADLSRLENEAYLALYETGEYESPFTEAQKNAMEVYRCVRRLQHFMYEQTPIYKESGPIRFDPIGFQIDENKQKLVAEKIREAMTTDPETSLMTMERALQHQMRVFGLEMMHLTLAAIKCDFYSEIWPHTQTGLGSNSAPKKKGRHDSLHDVIRMLKETVTSAQDMWKWLAARGREASHEQGKTTQVPFNIGPITITSINTREMIWKEHPQGRTRRITRPTFQNRISSMKKAENEKEDCVGAFYDANKWRATPLFSPEEWSEIRRKAGEDAQRFTESHRMNPSAKKKRTKKSPHL